MTKHEAIFLSVALIMGIVFMAVVVGLIGLVF